MARALSLPDIEQGLAEACELLREVGLEKHREGTAEVALAVEYGGRELRFEGAQLASELREGLAAVLKLGLMRASDQDDLGRARERMTMLSEASFEGIMIHVDGVVIDCNHRFAEMLGYEYEDMLGAETMRRCVAPEDLAATVERVKSGYEGEYLITGVRKDGTRFRAELQSKQGKLGARPVRVAAVRDVTERERTLRLLHESEARLRDLAREAFDVIVLSRDGIILDAGGPVEGLFGLTRTQMIGRGILELMPETSRRIAQPMIFERLAGSYQVDITNSAGELVPVEVVGVTSTLDGEAVRIAGLRDLRAVRRLEQERRKLEQRVERGQRLESLGVLAGGIAHDFNNLLVGMLGNADFLLEALPEGEAATAARAIRTAAERAAALTAQMLAYAGQRDRGRREAVDIGALTRELTSLLDAALSKKATLELDIPPGSLVLGDRATLVQVLMNLLTNASDALADKPGSIRVQARRVREPSPRWQHAFGNPVSVADWVELDVSDTGVGMDEPTLARIFEPFFSTKERGHGLGLAACLGIVAAHGGAILVESQPERGSRFSILLPSAEVTEAPQVTPPRVECPHPCHVLIVDDETVVRSFLKRSLERRGYQVSEAGDGMAGLAFLAEHTVDVVLLDMSMPELDGAETLKRLRASGSEVKVVLSSGYTEVEIEREIAPGSFQGFLVKPYGIAELVDMLERALGAS